MKRTCFWMILATLVAALFAGDAWARGGRLRLALLALICLSGIGRGSIGLGSPARQDLAQLCSAAQTQPPAAREPESLLLTLSERLADPE